MRKEASLHREKNFLSLLLAFFQSKLSAVELYVIIITKLSCAPLHNMFGDISFRDQTIKKDKAYKRDTKIT